MKNKPSFIANVNSIAAKLDAITSANATFDKSILPVLKEIASLDLTDAIQDLKKGTYLGNRKLDIDLSLNIQGITADNKVSDPAAAEALWVANSVNVTYNSATITFVDGTVVELPFLSDNNPTVITNAAGLLVQLNRTDVVNAVAQESSIYSFNIFDSTSYVVTIDNIDYTYTTGVGATQGEIVTGLTNQINSGAEPWTAYNMTDTVKIVADIAGNSFVISVDANMQVQELTANIPAGNYPTEFLTTLTNTAFNSFTLDTVNDTIRMYDVTGSSSNIEKIQLHTSNTASGYVTSSPVYFWGQTTSALEVMSMRAGDVIKLGNEIDKIILLANSISQVLEIQDRIPELIDTYINNVAQGDVTIYNKLDELHDVYTNLTALVGVYQDIQAGGNNYTNTVATDLTGSNTIGVVATDLNLGVNSNIDIVGNAIDNVNLTGGSITNVNTVGSSIINVNSVATTVVPNISEILQADNNAATATIKAAEAVAARDEIVNLTGDQVAQSLIAGSIPTAYYNSVTGKFTFGLPQGAKGDKGDSFQVNAIGPITNRSLYDDQAQGFSFLALDTSKIYFKQSSNNADWSAGSPFGKGDTGNGINNVSFTSTTGTAQGEAGETDTYTITYTDSTTDTFVVKNGIIPTKTDLGLDKVDNTSDANKPVSIATQTALNSKQAVLSEGAFINGDKTKLDSIASGATADQTKADIDALGIDAATVNGKTVKTSVPVGAVFTDTVFSSNYNDLINTPTIPTNNNQLINGAGYLTSETAHPADNLSAQDITNVTNLSGVNTGDQDLSGYSLTSHNHSLDGLSNTVISSPTDLQVLTYDAATSKWVNGVPAVGSSTLDGLTNVDTTGKAVNDIIQWDGTNWVSVTNTLATTSPVLTINSSINENTSMQGSYTSEAGSVVTLTADIGTITNHNTVAKTFTYNAPDVVDGNNDSATITTYANKSGQFQSVNTFVPITIVYVPSISDTTIQVVDIFNDLQTNTGFIGV